MRKLVILGSLLVFAAASANCAQDGANASSPSSIVAPSGVDGKPSGGGGSSSFALSLVTDANGDGVPNWGDRVTFNISTTATAEPHVDLKCSQNGAVVLGATAGFFASYPWPWTQTMTLASPSWTSGAADCTAVLYYFSGRRNTVLKSLSFRAYE